MPSNLYTMGQENFAAGMFRGVARHLIPGDGCYDLFNLLLDDDGSPSRRGGTEYLSNAALGTSLRWLWDGVLVPGQRTVFASATKFGTLAVDDATPVDLGGAGLAEPKRAAGLGGVLFIGGGTLYAGSRKAGDYSAGTVGVTQGSPTVTGSGFTANVDVGMLLRVGGAGRYYVVQSVDSNTGLTLTENYEAATNAAAAYVLSRLGSTSAAPYVTSDIYAVAGKRILAGAGRKVLMSGYNKPHSYAATDVHELSAGSDVLGIEAARDVGIVFATTGVWAIFNLAQELVDFFGAPQQRLELLTRDIVLWGPAGLASWQNSLVAPAVDGAWLIDGRSAPTRISRSIDGLWRSYVRAGYKPGGGAVYRNSYLLPVLDSSNAVVDVLVCRLDRPQQIAGIGVVYPWAHLGNSGANVTAYAQRVSGSGSPRAPALLGASRASTARVLNCSGYFEPSAARKADADGVAHSWDFTSRDLQTGISLMASFSVRRSLRWPPPGSTNLIRKIKVRYELVDAATDDPKFSGLVSAGSIEPGTALWDTALWDVGVWQDADLVDFEALPGQAGEDDGRHPHVWLTTKDGRYVRLRLRSSDPAASLVLRSIEFAIRLRRKYR